MTNIKHVYFDAGGVLFKFRNGLKDIAHKHNLNYSDFEQVFRKYDDQVVKGNMSAQKLWGHYQAELGFTENLDYLEYWVSKLSPIIETHLFVQELVDQNMPVGLITNLYSGVYDKAVINGKIPNIPYSSVIQSSAAHMMKPEIEIYLLAQKQAKVKPENILFTDDKPEFLEPAKRLGWETVLFKENEPTESISIIKSLM